VNRSTLSKSILTKTSGFLTEAGFTHSLTAARNCTFACTYCYVPTMRLQAGLQPEDWLRWGQFTTFKENAAELAELQSRRGQRIYCSPLVDPYQPAEMDRALMPPLLEALARTRQPPDVFTIQTRGPGILRDLELLLRLASRTVLRVSFSLTTNREDVRRLYEPLCATYEDRLAAIRQLREAGVEVYATLAPLLPCDPEILAADAIAATGRDLIGDPLHVRAAKPHGATTREAAFRIAGKHGHESWLDPAFQEEIVRSIDAIARRSGFRLQVGPAGFARLASPRAS
jgi:DNA repair photolyase